MLKVDVCLAETVSLKLYTFAGRSLPRVANYFLLIHLLELPGVGFLLPVVSLTHIFLLLWYVMRLGLLLRLCGCDYDV